MDFKEYHEKATEAARLVEAGQHEEGTKALESLIASDISEVDKAIMCMNIAIAKERLGNMEDALFWYDKGIAYESKHLRIFVTMQKAAYLAQKGRTKESLAIYKELLTKPFLHEGEKEGIRKNIETLESRMQGGEK
jgi:tetratricopeptide (TPR) repeat protein